MESLIAIEECEVSRILDNGHSKIQCLKSDNRGDHLILATICYTIVVRMSLDTKFTHWISGFIHCIIECLLTNILQNVPLLSGWAYFLTGMQPIRVASCRVYLPNWWSDRQAGCLARHSSRPRCRWYICRFHGYDLLQRRHHATSRRYDVIQKSDRTWPRFYIGSFNASLCQ